MTLNQLTQYYSNLLAFEYRGLSRADQQIQLYTKQFLADFLARQFTTCYSLDLAVGDQLDILGKYIGISRNIGVPLEGASFGLWTYASTLDPDLYQGTWNPTTDVPAIPAAAAGNNGWWYVARVAGVSAFPIAETFKPGDVIFSNGSVWAKETADNGNGLTTYSDSSVNANAGIYRYSFSTSRDTALSDEDYRLVLKFQVIQNTSDNTLASIMAEIHLIFPGQIALTDNANMTMDYYVLTTFPLSKTLLYEFLPRPMGVGITVTLVTSTDADSLLLTESGDYLTTESGNYLALT